jgi:hypothetical protein
LLGAQTSGKNGETDHLARISVIGAGEALCRGAQKILPDSGLMANDFAGTPSLE